MKIFFKTFLTLTLTVIPFAASAIVAKRGLRTVTEPDGTSLQINVTGDEHLHFITDADGNLLAIDDQGFYTYAEIAPDGAVVPTNRRVNDITTKSNALKLKDINIKSIKTLRSKAPRRAPQTGYGMCSSTFPTTGSPKALVILVDFTDKSFQLKNPADYFHDMINGKNFTQYGGTGSALQYFTDQSNGKFTPSFDVYGPVTLPNSYIFYGKNDRWGDDTYPDRMVTDAISILDPDVDFSQYDTDGDGVIDNVYVFYAGEGEATGSDSNTIWPHSWDVRYAKNYLTVDGVQVGHYACSNEWERTHPDGVGTFIHEFSHVLGLPDLYATDYNDDAYYITPGGYSALDYGPYNNQGRTPPNYGAFELNALGWYEPIIMDHSMDVTLHPIISGEFGLIPTSKNTEFFLFENRQLEGWDAYIPNHGMLIWHIDYNAYVFENNEVNNSSSHQYVDIEEANNYPQNDNIIAMKGWTFPGTTGKTSFTGTTIPALKTWGGSIINLPVTDITETNGLISFKVAGGGSGSGIDGVKTEEFINSSEPIEYYNLQGMRIDQPTKGSIVIQRQGNRTSKIIIN